MSRMKCRGRQCRVTLVMSYLITASTVMGLRSILYAHLMVNRVIRSPPLLSYTLSRVR